MEDTKRWVIFRRLGITTLISIYLLILVGGIVRSTGSGMGCPDWPKCFGQYIPPTDVSQLPTDYKDVYASKRKAKNIRLSGYLNKLGFEDLAFKITNDSSIYEEATFNPTKTWIEYLNRLLGAVIGFLILGTMIASLFLWKESKTIFVASFASFILVLIQAWIGSLVVSTNLLPGMITLHMMLAILIVGILIYAVLKSFPINSQYETSNRQLLLLLLVISLLISGTQVVFGTQVREMIDQVAQSLGHAQRGSWIEAVGFPFYLHRSFSWLVLLFQLICLITIFKSKFPKDSTIFKLNVYLLFVIIAEIITGVAMAYLAIPAFLQPVHLLLAVIILGLEFSIFFLLKSQTKNAKNAFLKGEFVYANHN